MRFADTPELREWRATVRSFVNTHWQPRPEDDDASAGLDGPDDDGRTRTWLDRLAENGWLAPAWPKKYGGAEMGVIEQFVMNEEFAEAGVPANVGGFGVMMLGPTLIEHGTEEQKAEHLGSILRGETIWCQGYSEPGAGSDLAALQTRAVRDGDDYVINGQKIWTTGAQFADWMYMLVRTDPDAPKHRGITYLLVDMKSPGVTVRPLTTMTGHQSFNEVFFEDVRVPVRNRVGEENRGWYVGTTTLDFERSSIGSAIGVRKTLEGLLRQVKKDSSPASVEHRSSVRHEFADRWIEAETARMLSYRVVSMQARGLITNYEASMCKLFSSDLGQRIANLSMHLFGMHGNLQNRSSTGYLQAVSSTIAGGTTEIQKGIIATRGLGLPR
jgi:alkylation response protein AidB-like acyl-CoA dehydrogenase